MDELDIFDESTDTLRRVLGELQTLIDAGQDATTSSRFAQAWRRGLHQARLEERSASEAVLAPTAWPPPTAAGAATAAAQARGAATRSAAPPSDGI